MVRTAINIYSVRDLNEPTPKVLDHVADAGYDGVQFSGRHSPLNSDPEKIKETIENRDLAVAPPHVTINDLENNSETVFDIFEKFGVRDYVIPYLDPDDFSSADQVDRAARRVSELADKLATFDHNLHYHNHDFEYVKLDAKLAFDRFLAKTDVGIEYDVGWGQVGGDDPSDRIREIGHRTELIHFKDMNVDSKSFCEIGEGDVDMAACAQAGLEVDAEWFIYEHDEPEDPKSSIDTGADYLQQLLAEL